MKVDISLKSLFQTNINEYKTLVKMMFIKSTDKVNNVLFLQLFTMKNSGEQFCSYS